MQGRIVGSYSCFPFGIGYITLSSLNGRKGVDCGVAQNRGEMVRRSEDLHIVRSNMVCVSNALRMDKVINMKGKHKD